MTKRKLQDRDDPADSNPAVNLQPALAAKAADSVDAEADLDPLNEDADPHAVHDAEKLREKNS